METRRTAFFVLVGLAAFSAWSTLAPAGESSDGPPTMALKLDFLKGYHSWSPRERREAATLLIMPQYRNDAQVGAALHDMAKNDKDPEIREMAFVALCSWQDLDGRLAWHLSRLFKLELEPAIKPRMALAMTQLKFKTDVLNELITYIFSRGVNFPNNGGNWNRNGNGYGYGWGWSGNNRGADWWDGANYRTMLQAINKMTGKRFVPANETARLVMEWWHLNAIDFQADDAKLVQQLREAGNGAPTLASVAVQESKPRDARLAEMFDRLEQENRAAEAKNQTKKGAAQKVPVKEEDIE